MAVTKDPSTPNPYVGVTLTLTGGTAVWLWKDLLQPVVAACPGAGHEVQIYADKANTDSVKVGSFTDAGADVSATNYGYEIGAGGSRLYRASVLGGNSPVGRLRVFCAATVTLHVEVIA